MAEQLTREVINQGEATYGEIAWALQHRKIPQPKKDVSGRYLWSEDNVKRLREALANRRTDRRRRRPLMEAASDRV